MFGLPLTAFLILAFLILIGVAIFNYLNPEFEDELPFPEEIPQDDPEEDAQAAPSEKAAKASGKNKKRSEKKKGSRKRKK